MSFPPEQPTAGEVVQTSIGGSVSRYLEHAPAIGLDGDTEGVHQARVATRRLRSDLRTFRPYLDTGWADELRSDLRSLTDLLGPARDLDVLHMRLAGLISQVPEPERRSAEAVLSLLDVERQDARRRVLHGFEEPWYRELLRRLIDAGEAAKLSRNASDKAGLALVGLAAKPWRKLRAAVLALPDDPSPRELHRIRILTKRARYAAEALCPIGGDAAEQFALSLSELQNVLGEHQDAIVAGAWLRRSDPDLALAAGDLIAFEMARADRASGDWRSIWASIDGGELTGWLEPL